LLVNDIGAYWHLAMPFPQDGYSVAQAGTGTGEAAASCLATAARRSTMSDYRDPNDPMYGNLGYEPADRRTNSGWGWIAAALFLVIVLALAFGVAHEPTRVASNDTRSAATHTTPPASTNPGSLPGLAPPPAPARP
jgi:hypothetical protein